jgi:multiple antibiotic resistance protein
METVFVLQAFITLFAVVDPVSTVPIFLGMSLDATPADRRRYARNATLAATLILLFFLFFGQAVFSAFDITLPAFRIAGGLIILIIALDLLKATHSNVRLDPVEREEASHKADISITPLGIPMLAGPAAISSVMVLSAREPSMLGSLTLTLILLVIGILTYFILRSSEWVLKALGLTGISVVSRLFGLVLLAMAVQFLIDGLIEAFALGAANAR